MKSKPSKQIWTARSQSFYNRMRVAQIEWRRSNVDDQKHGRQNGHCYEHILPADKWELNLWSRINSQSEHPLANYLKVGRIRKHSGSHNLLSSWALCANLYFPFRCESGYEMLAGFLQQVISPKIQSVSCVELEYEPDDTELQPDVLLGEMDGGRGTGQTSPDVAVLVKTENGIGVILLECKFTEHNFYGCSGRKPSAKNGNPNRDLPRCLNAAAVFNDPHKQCHLYEWGRRYWDHLGPVVDSQVSLQLKACPAAFGGYQLFRQQSLVEGIAQSGKFSMVVSAVAYDARNTGLMLSLKRSTGIADIRSEWKTLFSGKAGFSTFTHQEWVDWVRGHNQQGYWNEWLSYISKRYAM